MKHTFLESYLEGLIYKTASKYNHVAYVDGFSGPWQSGNEGFEDTSFWLALTALRKAKAAWKNLGREVTMSAHLVEKDPVAFLKLKEIGKRFPDVSVSPYRGDFVDKASEIRSALPKDAFSFFSLIPRDGRYQLKKSNL